MSTALLDTVAQSESAPSTRRSAAAAENASAADKALLIVRAVVTGASAALLVAVLFVAALVIALPAITGGQALTVLTNSMAPSMPPGTLVVIQSTPIEDIAVGDVITYQIESGKSAVVTHRVTQRMVASDGTTTFMTQGDNNEVADALPVREVQLRGTVWYALPLLGWVNSALTGPTRAAIVPLAALACFGYAAFAFVSTAVARRRSAA